MTTPQLPGQPGNGDHGSEGALPDMSAVGQNPQANEQQPNGYGPPQPDPQGYGQQPGPQGYGQGPQTYGQQAAPQGYGSQPSPHGNGQQPGPQSYGQPQGQQGYGPAQPNPQGYGPPQAYGPPQSYGPPPAGQGYQTYGQPGGAGYHPPGYGQGQFGLPPAPKPGIVSLRPLGLGDILDGAFKALRFNPKTIFGLAAIFILVQVIIELVLTFVSTSVFSDLVGASDDPYGDSYGVAQAFSTLTSSGSTVLIGGVISGALAGLLVIPVSRAILGQRISLSETWRAGKSRIWPLIGLTLLITAIYTVLVVVIIVVATLLIMLSMDQPGIAVLSVFLATFAVIAFMLFFHIRTIFASPALVLEELGVMAAFKRGWALSKGRFWRTLGINILVSIIISLISYVITIPLAFIGTMTTFATGGIDQASFGMLLTVALSTFAAGIITAPFRAAAISLLYTDARIRDEGLDIELIRAASTLP